MGRFTSSTGTVPLTERAKCESRIRSAQYNLLLTVALSLINLILLLTGGDIYFLYAAQIPYQIVLVAMLLTGRLPLDTEGSTVAEPLGIGFLVGMVLIAIALIAVYLLLWFLSRKFGSIPLFVAAGFLIADTVLLFVMSDFNTGMLLDFAFHAFAVSSFIMGALADRKLRALPPDPAPSEQVVLDPDFQYADFSAESEQKPPVDETEE